MIHTGDTNVLLILMSNFHHIMDVNPVGFQLNQEIHPNNLDINVISSSLEGTMCKAMVLFHVFTDLDNTSTFKLKGKRYMLQDEERAACTPTSLSPTLTLTSSE